MGPKKEKKKVKLSQDIVKPEVNNRKTTVVILPDADKQGSQIVGEEINIKESVVSNTAQETGRNSENVLTDRPRDRPSSKATTVRSSVFSEMSADEELDIIYLTINEITQKLVHCHVGKDLYVDKTWCLVKKADILEDIAIEDANSPFFNLTHRILAYKPDEFLIGYEPFAEEKIHFMMCITEAGRDETLNKLESMKMSYQRRIYQSKQVKPKKWESLGSEEFVDQFQIKNTRKLISLEWIGDISKRCFTEPVFTDCDPDDMKNGYTCLVPSDKEKFELVFKKTQETATQARAQQSEASIQTEPEIPTNACTQYAPETEISVSETTATEAAITSQDLNAFFKKYLDYLTDCLEYNEVYDLYHDDYPALYVAGEETQVQHHGTYHQYQSFTDVAAIEGKLVVSCSWHPNYTGIIAIAYANEIPCLMKELEYDSDQTDYEDELTDDEKKPTEEPEPGAGAKGWMEAGKKEAASIPEDTEMYDKAMKRLKEIEATKMVWDGKIQEDTVEMRKPVDELDISSQVEQYEYKEYKEPKAGSESEHKESTEEDGIITEVLEAPDEAEGEDDTLGLLVKEDTISPKTSRTSFREQLEADIQESPVEVDKLTVVEERSFVDFKGSLQSDVSHLYPMDFSKTMSLDLTLHSDESLTSHKKAHHRKKKRKNVPKGSKISTGSVRVERDSATTYCSSSLASFESISEIGKPEPYYHDHEIFDEVTDEEEMKEKQDELPLLELNNPVLIWSFVDDLTPKLRLDSPYEVRVVEFSKHDGNLIAGGTASGQIVLWDITGRIQELERPEALTQDQQIFRKRMEEMMDWRKDIRSKRRVRLAAISNKTESHLEKVTSLKWLGPTTVVTDNVDVIKNPSNDPSLLILTCSIAGDIKVWNLNSDPMKIDSKKQVQQFKTKERFGRPISLDVGMSPFNKLHKRWKPNVSLTTNFKGMPVLLTGLHPHGAPIKYVRVHPRLSGAREVLEDRIEYKAVCGEFFKMPLQLYIGNVFGKAGTIMWDPPEEKPADGGFISHTCQFWDSYHDGPVFRVTKHAYYPNVCLSVGGHVFAIWHTSNTEEPVFVKRYHGVYVTDGIWSNLRPSLIRIARSDGVVEIWDLIIQTHAPATTIIVSGRIITNISPPLLPEAKGLLGVADYNSAFCLFYIPQQFRMWTEDEFKRMKMIFDIEPERKNKMKAWSKWWRDNNVNLDREEKKQAEEQKKLDEEVRLEKEKQEEARKKYNEEVYKWYMRRRGKPFLWREEAEERWREKQEEHMHEMVMAKKKTDRSEMEILMRPIVREEKNEEQKHAKAQERLKHADVIFRQAVELIFPKTSRKISRTAEEQEKFNEQFSTMIDYYNGENFEKLADEQDDIIQRSPWQFDFEWSELLEKYNTLRMLFNDRRRKRSKTLRWLRKKLREELLKEGRKVHIRKSHMARYPKRKIKRRQQNLEQLKELYGDDYNVYWDKHQPCRRFADRKFRYPIDEKLSMSIEELSEPDVDDEEMPELLTEQRVKSNLELMTDLGIEYVPEETFAADLDAALITLESRPTLGVKSIPSLVDVSSKKISAGSLEQQSTRTTAFEVVGGLLLPPRAQSPQSDSDVSMIIDEIEDTTSIVDNQMQELDYIQQSIGTKINTLQTKKVASSAKREISEGIKLKFEESSSEEEDEEEDEILNTIMDDGEEIADSKDEEDNENGEEMRDEDKEQTDESLVAKDETEIVEEFDLEKQTD